MDEHLQKQSNESFSDWKYRIIIGKIEKVIDLDWIEIRDLLGLSCSPDHLRKTAYGMYEYKQYIEEKTLDDSELDVIDDIKDKEVEFLKAKVKYQDQRREFMKLIRDEARVEHNKEIIFECVTEIAKSKPLQWIPYNLDKSLSDKETVLLLSDWHTGLFTSNYWNEFNLEIFESRISKLVQKTIEYSLLNESKVLHMFLLGDLVNGIIHLTTRIANMEDIIQQTMRVSEVISEMVAQFTNHFEEIKIYNCIGNHERVTPNKSDSLNSENFAKLIPWYLESRLKHIDSVKIITDNPDDEIIVTEICGYKIFGLHGQNDRISNVVQNLTLMLKEFPDYIFMGHYHHLEENECHSIEIITNGTLSGTDNYAKEIRKTSTPSQRILIFSEEEGRLCTYNVKF